MVSPGPNGDGEERRVNGHANPPGVSADGTATLYAPFGMGKARRIAVVTTGRADYGLLIPVMRQAVGNGDLDASFYVTGAHLCPTHGMTVTTIEADGWPIGARVSMPSGDHPGSMGEAIGRGVSGFTGAFISREPDAVLVLGDRFETLAAAVAASACGKPIVHLHGGEVSTGAVDNQFRYAVSALAQLHLVATERARARLVAMGEDPARVVRVGAPGLDLIAGFEPLSRIELNQLTGLAGDGPFLLVTLHPTTLDDADPAEQAHALVAALRVVGLPCLVTAANQDPGGNEINTVMRSASGDAWVFVEGLGPGLYHSAMAHAATMVGNSSSGIIEAASLGLPVVNIGDRQAGRERSGNVIDCGHGEGEIVAAIGKAIAMGRRGYENVYGDGNAATRIVRALALLDGGTLRKRFEPPGL